MRLTAMPFLVLLVLLGGCEVPGDEAPRPAPVPEQSSEDPSVATAEAARRAAAEQAEAERRAGTARDEQSEVRTVDGRRLPGLRARSAPPAVASVVAFSDPGAPSPVTPPAAKLTIARRAAPIGEPARRDEPFSSLVVVAEDEDVEWEAALLRKGAIVLDRSMLPWLERELYLQEAFVSDQDAARIARPDPQLMPALVVTGREPYDLLDSTFWIRAGVEGFRPLLSGRAAPTPGKLPVGVAESATAVLRVGKIAWRDDALAQVVVQPAAALIRYAAMAGDEAGLGAADAAWQADAADPWSRRCQGGIVCFDPESKALWRLDRAWLGGPVTRDAYIASRTRDEGARCVVCGRPVPGRSKIVKPEEKTTPVTWWCPDCKQSDEVAYFDGYAALGGAHGHDHAVVEWQWVEPASGLYPVVKPPAFRAGARAFELGGAAGWSHADLARSLAQIVAPPAGSPGRMCWVRPDGSAVLFDDDRFASFERRVVDGKQRVRMPACEPSGAQRYALEREPAEVRIVTIPIAVAEVDVRMAMSASTRLVMAGRFALDYRNLLAEDVEIPVDAGGPELSRWPSLAQQRAALLATLRQRLADALVK